LYTVASLAAHAERLVTFLGRAATAARLSEVPTLTSEECRKWTVEVNATDHPVPETTLTALLETSMARHRSAEALVSDSETLTYAELDQRTAALADGLAAAGVRRGDLVAIDLPRSIDL